MGNPPNNEVIRKVQKLYKESALARQFFDSLAERLKDASATSVDLMSRSLGVSRGDAVALAKTLERTGCGEFVLGRRGSKSRFVWSFSCVSVGLAAAGEATELEETTNPEPEPDDDIVTTPSGPRDTNESPLSIAEAKRRLALGLGVPEASIEITVRA